MRVDLSRIMCVTDLSEYSNTALDYGLTLAKEFQSRLYLCHVVDIPFVTMYAEATLDPIQIQNRIMNQAHENFERKMVNETVPWEPIITVGNTITEISRLVRDKAINLAISVSYGRRGIKRLMLGSITESLIRSVACPILVARHYETESGSLEMPGFKLDKILVGYDFSKDSALALEYALSFAQEFEAELHLVHVMEPTAYRDMLKTNLEVETRYHEEIRELLIGKLNRLVPQEARNWCTPVVGLLEGYAYHELTKYSKDNNINLVIMGTRGLNLMETLLMGSTTDRVIRQAPCPVLSVHLPV